MPANPKRRRTPGRSADEVEQAIVAVEAEQQAVDGFPFDSN